MSKLQRLRDNIAAIEEALSDKSEKDIAILEKYTGFGGLGFILNDIGHKETWSKSDQPCYDDTVRLRQMLVKASKDGNEFDRWMSSLKQSVLTAFYTPDEVVKSIFQVIYKSEFGPNRVHIAPRNILDPAAGIGVFALHAAGYAEGACGRDGYLVTAFEKDILTGTLLNANKGYAKMQVFVDGFENFPNDELGMYDLVTTNVPFGNIPVYDAAYKKSGNPVLTDAAKMIHRYYVLKGLDCLRNGGIEAYIITSNYLNNDGDQLAEALKRSRLIGAYRLAGNLFKENGTEVGTDLLVLQKDDNKQGISADESMLLTQFEDNGCPTNLYFQCYPDHIICTSWTVGTDAYGKRAFEYMHRGGVQGIAGDLLKVFAQDMRNNCDAALFESAGKQEEKTEHTAKTQEQKEEEYKAKFPKKAQGKMLTEIYEVYKQLYEYEATELKENTELRKKLNQLYDKYVAAFGMINPSTIGSTANRLKVEAVSLELLGLERVDEKAGRWTKADILLKPVAFSMDDIHEAGTVQEALAQSLNDYGHPDMQYMEALTGKSENEILDELKDEVFFDPISECYEIKAKFICGNVIEKIDRIREKYGINPSDVSTGEVMEALDPRVARSLAALEDAVPTPIPFEDLDFNLGERWVSPDIYSRFASDFFSMPDDGTWRSGKVTVTVRYNRILDRYAASRDGYNEKVGSQFCVYSEATREVDAMDLLAHALQNTCPKMMRYQRDKNGHYIYNDKYEKLKEEDPDKTQLANDKIEKIRQAYVDWLQHEPKDFRDRLADTYNRRFNCFVKPTYNGSHQTFPGIDMKGLKEKYGIDHIYDSQKDCVWMLLLNGGGICDHEVGSGKTLIMCMAAHEMKRLGMCHKPMIIGLKANVSAIAETYRTAYPQARVLFATESDYSAANRVAFFNNMKNNDYDCIIMSHEQFGRIPQSDDIQLEILQEELQHLDEALKTCSNYGWNISSKMRKGLEIRKRNTEAKVRSLQDDIRDRADDVVDFAMMGIDHIFVDESHQFKNLGFSTLHDRVAGIGNTEGSKRAFNLLMAIRAIQRKTGRDLGATFLSGTTVTNSLTELYSLFRYLRPKELAKQDVSCFDAWAAIFTKKSQEFEFSITNSIIMKERFRYFIKVPELAMFYNEVTDFKTAEDVGIERPKKHAMLLKIQPTPDQEEFIQRLMKFAKTGDFSLIGIDHPTDKQQKAKMLYATDLARKMSLDMRMIDPSYPDHPRSKASRCAELVKKYYDQYDHVKGTQLVFSDLSTWQNNTDWSVYSEIKKKLVEDYGIPASEVRFIQECKSDRSKQQLIADVNKGKVRVLFGSTSMLGTGVNAQERVVAVHHLDTPWRPSDLEQRDGRAVRKGNWVARDYAGNQVDIIIYAVERSLDSYKFQLLHSKQTFINQLKRGQLSVRTLDEGSMDENTGMNFAEYMAVLSGNRDLLERARMEKKIAGLEADRKNFFREHAEQEMKLYALREDNDRCERDIRDARRDYDQFMKVKRLGADDLVENDLTIDGFTLEEGMTPEQRIKALGERLLQLDSTVHTDGVHIPIGSIYGFPVMVRTVKTFINENGQRENDNVFSVKGSGFVKYTSNNGYLNRKSPRISAAIPLQALLDIPVHIDAWEKRLADNTQRIAQLEEILKLTWDKEDELKKLRHDLGILDRKINEDLKKTESSQDGYKTAA